MKKRFSRRAPSAVLPGPLALGIGALICVFALLFGLLRLVAPGFLVTIATPFWQLGTAGTEALHGFEAYGTSIQTLVTERDSLQEQNDALAQENRLLLAQIADIGHLATASSTLPDGVLAGVLVRPPVSPYDTLIVHLPAGAAVAVGDSAYGAGGVPVGTVESVEGESARLILYSAPGKTTDAWVGAKRVPIALTGTGAGAFSSTVTKGSTIAAGDMVYVAGPGALPIGTVVRVDTDASSPEATLAITGFSNPFSITWVRIQRSQ